MTHLEQIREACIKANPEILKLEFGCVVQMEGVLTPEAIIGTLVNEADIVYKIDTATYHNTSLKMIKEILGRPIRLADVLLAINHHSWIHDIDVPKVLNLRSDAPYQALLLVGTLIDKWEKSKDDLTLQSEETIDFIHSVLFN